MYFLFVLFYFSIYRQYMASHVFIIKVENYVSIKVYRVNIYEMYTRRFL